MVISLEVWPPQLVVYELHLDFHPALRLLACSSTITSRLKSSFFLAGVTLGGERKDKKECWEMVGFWAWERGRHFTSSSSSLSLFIPPIWFIFSLNLVSEILIMARSVLLGQLKRKGERQGRERLARMSTGSREALSWNPNTHSVRLYLGSVRQLTRITPYNRATYSSAGYSWPGSGSLNTRRTKAKSMQSICNILQQWK